MVKHVPHHEQPSEKERPSIDDLIVYNEQGQATLDINKLVYKPEKKKHDKDKERLSWYLPDYIFVIFNFLSLTYATYYFINGLTIITWRNTMQMFSVQNCETHPEDNIEICKVILDVYGAESEDMQPYTIIRFFGTADPSNHGLAMFVIGIASYINIIIGVSACIDGAQSLLISHMAVDGILLVFELILVVVLLMSGRCDSNDVEIIRAFLQRHMDNYANSQVDDLVKKDTEELDLIQLSLTCCGVGNWTEYLPRSTWNESNGDFITRSVLSRSNLDKSEMILPSSCCRQWWVRNLYCAHEAHLWAYPTTSDLESHQFRQRISQFGCLPKMVGLCKNIVTMAGTGGMIAWGTHCLLSIVRITCAITQIKKTNNMLVEKKNRREANDRNAKRKGNFDIGEEDFPAPALFGFFSDSDSEVERQHEKEKLPSPPKEKDIAAMKSRLHFNRMKSAMTHTHMEDWMKHGKEFVEGKPDLKRGGGGPIIPLENLNKPTRQREEANIQQPRNKNPSGREEERNAALAMKMLPNAYI